MRRASDLVCKHARHVARLMACMYVCVMYILYTYVYILSSIIYAHAPMYTCASVVRTPHMAHAPHVVHASPCGIGARVGGYLMR